MACWWFRERAKGSPAARTLTQCMEEFESRTVKRDYGIRESINMFDELRLDEK